MCVVWQQLSQRAASKMGVCVRRAAVVLTTGPESTKSDAEVQVNAPSEGKRKQRPSMRQKPRCSVRSGYTDFFMCVMMSGCCVPRSVVSSRF